jgi:hypothetical protein
VARDGRRPRADGTEEQRDALRIYAGSWTQDSVDEVEGFPGAALKDFVDATSGAWAWLEAHPFGAHAPPQVEAKATRVQLVDMHPDDRPDPRDERHEPERWRP